MNSYKVFFEDKELVVEADSVRGAQLKVMKQCSLKTEVDLFVVLVAKSIHGVDLVGCQG